MTVPRTVNGTGQISNWDTSGGRCDSWSHDDENYSILETWCYDVINRNAEIDNLPLHRLRRNIIDVSRWIPGGFRDHATVDFEPYY